MYNVYAHHKIKGMEFIDSKETETEAEALVEYLKKSNYYSFLVVHKMPDRDEVVKRIDLTKECEVEYVDNLKPKYEVKAMTFKPSKMKKKEQLRKEIEDYLK